MKLLKLLARFQPWVGTLVITAGVIVLVQICLLVIHNTIGDGYQMLHFINGTLIPVVVASPLFYVLFILIRELRSAQAELHELAMKDHLTQTLNRRHFAELAEIELERMRRFSHPLTVLLIDADHFKNINDTYGHLTGDQVLQQMAHVMRDRLRAVDILGRFGGEEFCVLLPDTDRAGAEIAAERIREGIETEGGDIDQDALTVTASVGAAVASLDQPLSLDALFERADEALYLAKSGGRNRVIFSS